MKVIWLLLLLTFTWTLPSACVRAETGQIIAKTETNPQSDNMETDLQSEMVQTNTMQHLLDDLELTQVQKMLDDMLGENSFSLTDTLVSLTRGEKIFSGKDLQGIFYRIFFGQLEKQKGLYIRILLLILLAAVFSNFAAVFDNGQIGDTCFYVVYLLLFMVCMDSFSGMSRALQNVLSWMAEFMRVLAPAYFLTVRQFFMKGCFCLSGWCRAFFLACCFRESECMFCYRLLTICQKKKCWIGWQNF